MSLETFPGQQSFQIWVTIERHAEEVEYLAFLQFGTRPNTGHRRQRQCLATVQAHLQYSRCITRNRCQVVHHVKELNVVDSRDRAQQLERLIRVIVEETANIHQRLRSHPSSTYIRKRDGMKQTIAYQNGQVAA